MPKILTVDELRDKLHAKYNRSVNKESKIKREENIHCFIEIDRTELSYDKLEKRIFLYNTLLNEKNCIQYPGKESTKKSKKPYDFRPKLIMSDGTTMRDVSFGFIWDLINIISQKNNSYLCFVATFFWYLGYMHGFTKTRDMMKVDTLRIDKRKKDPEVIQSGRTEIEWWHLDFEEDIWYSLNNYIGPIPIGEGQNISFEALIKLVDLLMQNEDCKYYYIAKYIKEKENYKLDNGRTKTADTNMSIIMYFEKNVHFQILQINFKKEKA